MACVELPKDATGREIPLDTEVLYDKEGKRREVDWYTYYPDKDRWDVVFEDSCVRFSPCNLSLTQPDSWKRLKEDLRRTIGASDAICAYFGGDNRDCVACRLNKESFKGIPYCNQCMAFTDILNRILKLRGEDE